METVRENWCFAGDVNWWAPGGVEVEGLEERGRQLDKCDATGLGSDATYQTMNVA